MVKQCAVYIEENYFESHAPACLRCNRSALGCSSNFKAGVAELIIKEGTALLKRIKGSRGL
jgi:hypothetical protein